MDSKYTPGEGHIVDEITNRFLEKERANTSLLRYLHEQQVSLNPSPCPNPSPALTLALALTLTLTSTLTRPR